MKKYFIWGFPGVGKSSVNSELRIVDADCGRFEFVISRDRFNGLHSPKNVEYTQRDPSYPDNYWEYVRSVDADVVLLNCHISLLGALDRENLLLVYPSAALKEEYLQRYTLRGDNRTYIHYMETAFDEMIAAVKNSPYRKYEITDPHIYLQNLIEQGAIMEQFTSRQEQLLHERRGGLSHEELSGKIMEGIVNGALSIRHDQIAPYSYGYEVTFRRVGQGSSYRWECYCPLPKVAEQITCKIENATPQVDITALLAGIALSEQNKITYFALESASGLQPRGRYTGHVANAQDVHLGIALDGIIQGHFQGDYSSMTTGTQNDTVRALVALKGFCLDCVHKLPSRPLVEFVIGYLKDHGTDISTPEKLDVWIRENPDKCALPENRERILPGLEVEETILEKGKKLKKHKNTHER